MDPDDRLVQRIDFFLRECGAKLDSLAPAPQSFSSRMSLHAGRASAENALDAGPSGSSPQRYDELRRATELLREALREWNAEKQEHERTKTMLRLALQELRGIHSSRDLASLVHGHATVGPTTTGTTDSPRVRSGLPSASGKANARQATAVTPTRVEGEGALNDNETMLEAPSFYFRSSLDRSDASPLSPSHRRHEQRIVARPLSFPPQEATHTKGKTKQTPAATGVMSLHSPYQRGPAATASARPGSSVMERRASPTSPFASRVARFQEVAAAGDQIVFGTPRENRLNGGLRYKTAADVHDLLSESHRPPLNRYALQAQAAIERLHERLVKSPRSRTIVPQ